MKDLREYTLEEFQNMENFGEDSLFTDVIIVPMNELHDSGYRCMKFILVYQGKIVGVVSGWSDVVHPNGIGNYGNLMNSFETNLVPSMYLSIDCLSKSGCVRLMMAGKYKCDDFIGSDFIFFKERMNDSTD